ncbi:uncharacterized protein [Ptychodera flava]|uniref:uncharacterized protein n=1 Tax=Ptychodera flava TaxID=63121 RepID=UPI00396A319E
MKMILDQFNVIFQNAKSNEELLEDETTPRNIRRLALEWLNRCQDWLLVIDNVLEPELIKTYFPDQPQLHDGHILITTRVTQGWDTWYNAIKTHVQHMTPEDSAIYLLRQKHSQPDQPISSADAEQMLSDLKENNLSEYEALMWLGDDGALQGLPLALFQASRYISTCKVTFKKYKDLYFKCRMDVFKNINTDPLEAWLVSCKIDRKFGPALREIVHSNTILVKTLKDQELKEVGMKPDEITNFNQARQETAIERFAQMVDPSKDDIMTTWKMNYDQVYQHKIAREFIQLCSCLSSRVQVALLVDGVQYLNPSSLKDYILSRRRGSTGCCQTVIHERVLELFQHLQQYSFATMIIGQTDDRRAKVDLNRLGAFIVPNLLKEVVFLKLISRDEKIRSLNHAMNILEKLFPKIEDVQADRLDILYSEAVRDYHSIIAFHTLALAHQMESLEQDDITHLNNTNRLFSSVGTYLRRLGRFRDAKTLYKLMVKFSKWRRPPRECDLGEELRCLGKVHYNMKQFKKAKIYFEESRKVFKKMNGEDDITVAFAMQGLGRVLQNDQDYMKTAQHRDEVEQLLKATLEKKIAYFNKSGENDHYSIAHAKHQLGRFYQDTGNCTKAHDLMKESYEMRNKYWLRKYGTIETVDVAVGMTNFARNYLVGKGNGECRNLDEAEKLLLDAEKIKQQRMPDSNESYQLALYYLATLYRERGMLEKAEDYRGKIILDEYQKLFTDMKGKKKYAEVYPPEKTIWM